MADPAFLSSLTVEGFRAYLQPKTFDFSKKRNMAVFAPNGNGKSSLIDAIEFVFSKDGTLEKLGQRAVNNQAGPIALAHNLADEAKIVPLVRIASVLGKVVSSGERQASGSKRTIPAIAEALGSNLVVSPIIRGHALRAFVEEHKLEKRYEDVAGWLQLGPLVEVQRNLRALRMQVKAAAEDQRAVTRIDSDLSKETAQAVITWDDADILFYVNTVVMAPLDAKQAFAALDQADRAYPEVVSRAKAEENKIGLAGLRQMRVVATALSLKRIDDEGETVLTGVIHDFNVAVDALGKAKGTEADERSKAGGAMFSALWEAAQPLFVEGAPALEGCPVCTTPIAATAAGSANAIRDHISTHLDELALYAAAKAALVEAEKGANNMRTRLVAALTGLIGLLGDGHADLKAELVIYQTGVAGWPAGEAPDAASILDALVKLVADLNQDIKDIEKKQGNHTYIKAKSKIDRLFDLRDERTLALRTSEELTALSDGLTTQASTVAASIRKKVQSLLDTLQNPMNAIYKAIQGDGAKPIRLELPGDDETNQQRLHLLIDFADNRSGVQPGGYLSDSQLHSVALALRMAAIKQFNSGAPILALDDIVTSYDADHRRTIAALIATMFNDCQIIVTTHDERFFNYLKDQLEAKTWQFTRIIGLDTSYGPRFADHKVSDEMIEARWIAGQSAANEMRQAEEEWLLGICRDFGVSVRIRPLEKAYSYERSELASALASLLNSAKLEPALVPGVNNRFLTSLSKGEIENFGSHFQNAPYGDGSTGDEKARWEEFKAFRSQFGCKKCSRTRFQRPFTLKKPVCAHDGCEAQFEFATA